MTVSTDQSNDKPVEVRLTDETIDYLEQRLAGAMAKAVSQSMTEEVAKEFWAAGIKVLREQAAQRTGRFVLGGLGGLASRVGTFILLGGLVYAIGGWAALAKLWQALSVSTP